MQTAVTYSVDDKRLIQNTYRRLQRAIGYPDLSPEDKDLIYRSYKLAYHSHIKQRRKSGEPYVTHPLEVAIICKTTIGLGPTAIACAILHDVVEDTAVTQEEINEQFGKKIGKIVDGLTKLDGLYNVTSPQAENFKKVLSTLVEDVRVVLIKMADRLHNLRTISSMPHHKQLKIAAETNYIYAPLAHRLGLYNIRTEFQDLCLKINEPEVYLEIKEKLQETKEERALYIKNFVKPLKYKLDQLGYAYNILGRPKSISSIWNKINTKLVSFEEIYDLFAIRIIVDVDIEHEKSICWQIYSIITDVHRPIPERLKDWITTPKSNGYESLHTTVIGPKGKYVEVQIRSNRMNEIAERGFAAHWKYKGIQNQSYAFENWFDNIRDILEEPNSDAVEFLDDFKTNLFKEEVYVYTPNGDMMILPKGASALDFAFAVHTDVGYRAIGIKVNGKLVPMGHQLNSGDQISVQTNKTQKPNESWLKMVVTGKARSKIRSAMKEERTQQGELGKEALMRKFKNYKINYESGVEALVKHLKLKSRVDLFYMIATGEINLIDLLRKFDIDHGKLLLKESNVVEDQSPTIKKDTRASKVKVGSGLIINGEPASTYQHSFATCCNPVQGDSIFAYINASQELKIHRANCPNATHLMANFGYRILKAEWIDTTSTNFVVDIHITGIDDGPGVIQRLTKAISNDLNLNIRSFSIEGNEGYFSGKVSIIVLNKDQLNLAIKNILKIKGVSHVVRVN